MTTSSRLVLLVCFISTVVGVCLVHMGVVKGNDVGVRKFIFVDSKTLTEPQRESLFEKIKVCLRIIK